jgi:hypothetical protein
MYGRYNLEVSEQNSLSFAVALVHGSLLAAIAMVVSLNVVEVGLAIWEFIPAWR